MFLVETVPLAPVISGNISELKVVLEELKRTVSDPSASTVTYPVPVSTTSTFELPSEIES